MLPQIPWPHRLLSGQLASVQPQTCQWKNAASYPALTCLHQLQMVLQLAMVVCVRCSAQLSMPHIRSLPIRSKLAWVAMHLALCRNTYHLSTVSLLHSSLTSIPGVDTEEAYGQKPRTIAIPGVMVEGQRG